MDYNSYSPQPNYPDLHIDSAFEQQSPFYPQFEEQIQSLRFCITEEEAQKKYREWIQSLWLAPTGFKKQAMDLCFGRHYIPCFSVSVRITVEYSGEVRSSKPLKEEKGEWEYLTGYVNHEYTNLVIIADKDPKVLEVAKNMQWEIVNPESASRSSLIDSGSFVHTSQNESWGLLEAQNLIQSKEHQKAAEYLKSGSKRKERERLDVRDVKSTVTFGDHFIRLIYLPAYISSFNYQNKDHVFVVNGVTGRYDGQRPAYGLGRIGDYYKGASNFVGTLWGSNKQEVPAVIPGSELLTIDQVSIYNPHNFFVTFPRSDSYMITESWGVIHIQNNGEAPIQIWPQKRCGSQRGKSYDLKPLEILKISFAGYWVLEITYGNPGDLIVVDVQTSGGTRAEDHCGMLE